MTETASSEALARPGRRHRVLRWVGGAIATLLVLYFVGVPVGASILLKVLLTPGGVDWSQSSNPNPPTDPLILNYRGDPKTAFGYDFQTITYTTELGDAEAWLVPAASPSPVWALYMHGIGGLRENGYRQLSVLREARDAAPAPLRWLLGAGRRGRAVGGTLPAQPQREAACPLGQGQQAGV